MLSDKIKALTTAVGIEPCPGCQERAATLDQWERRGFMKTGALAVVGLKNSILKLAWEAAGATVPVSVQEALGFIRTLNTIQTSSRSSHEGKHATLGELFGPEGILMDLRNFKPGTLAFGWASRLNLSLCYFCTTREAQQNGSACPSPPKDGTACNCSHNEALPGWTLEYAAIADSNYPCLALAGDATSRVQDGYRLGDWRAF
jgi:hypothetical protein